MKVKVLERVLMYILKSPKIKAGALERLTINQKLKSPKIKVTIIDFRFYCTDILRIAFKIFIF